MQGKIIKGIAGFYYVHTDENVGLSSDKSHVRSVGGHTENVYECKAKGIFRNRKIKPLVGDNVVFEVLDEETMTGNIIDILPRTNALIRPASANITQAMVIFAAASPTPNLNLLDRFLVMMDYQEIPTVICFNKSDLITQAEKERLSSIYANCGCEILFTSTKELRGTEEVQAVLHGKTTILAGPSGVGKSSMTNLILPDAHMQTGDVSKIGRGRHTTRHSEIFYVEKDTYIMDTPGFTSMNLPEIEAEKLHYYYPEFALYEDGCKFNGCVHVNEPSCMVKEAVEQEKIHKTRYLSYTTMYEELKAQKKY